jgi:IS30 family transposase
MEPSQSHYQQLQPEDRVTIAGLRQQNCCNRAIARQLHRFASSVQSKLDTTAITGTL